MLRAGQCRFAELTKQVEVNQQKLGTLKPEQRGDAQRQIDEGYRFMAEAANGLAGKAEEFKAGFGTLEARARLLYDAAWAFKFVAAREVAETRDRLRKELQAKLQGEADKKAAPGTKAPAVPLPEVARKDVPVQPAEKRARECYQALVNSFEETLLSVRAGSELAEMLAERDEFEPAIKLLKDARDKEPSDAKETPADLLDAIKVRLGACYAANKQLKEAAEQFESVAANAKSPLMAQVLYRVGECRYDEGKFEEAEKALTPFRDRGELHNIAGVSDRALLRLGQTLAHEKKWDAARVAFETFVNRYGGSPLVHDARYGLGWARQNTAGQTEQAVEAYNAVIAGTASELAAKAHLQIGLCRASQKRYAEAAASFLTVAYSFDFPELAGRARRSGTGFDGRQEAGTGRAAAAEGPQGPPRHRLGQVGRRNAQVPDQVKRSGRSTMTRTKLLALIALAAVGEPARAYVEAAYPLSYVVGNSTNICVMTVTKVDKAQNIVVYQKVRDIKGKHPQETIKHIIRKELTAGEIKEVMNWAEVGKTAVFFHNGGASETCIGTTWYQCYPQGEFWDMTHGEPFLLRSYCGKPDKLPAIVTELIAGKEVLVPGMEDDKAKLHKKTGKIQRLKTSMKLMDYNPKRDFAGWGGEDIKPVSGMPGFSHLAPLGRVDAEGQSASAVDFDGDGKLDVVLVSTSKVILLQNQGDSFGEIFLPGLVGGARAAVWGDFTGDGKPDLFLATAAGPKLYTNLGGGNFRDDTGMLPKEPGYNLTAAAWLDIDGDGLLDLVVSNGHHGMKVYKNKRPADAVTKLMPPKLGPWHYAGPFPRKPFDAEGHPLETGVLLEAQYSGKNDTKVTWKKGAFNDGAVNNLALFGKPELNTDAAVYLYREIECNSQMELPCGFGSDDSLKVWCNGEFVAGEDVARACLPDQNRGTLKLKAGKNQLLIRVGQGTGEWAFAFKAGEPQFATNLWFDDVTAAWGLDAVADKVENVATTDVNGDGKPDLLLGGGKGLLFVNTGANFVLKADAGLDFKPGKVGPTFGDFDGDGHPDLFVPQPAGVGKLYRNDGTGKFVDVTASAGDLAKVIPGAVCRGVGRLQQRRQTRLGRRLPPRGDALLRAGRERQVPRQDDGRRPDDGGVQHAGDLPRRHQRRRQARPRDDQRRAGVGRPVCGQGRAGQADAGGRPRAGGCRRLRRARDRVRQGGQDRGERDPVRRRRPGRAGDDVRAIRAAGRRIRGRSSGTRRQGGQESRNGGRPVGAPELRRGRCAEGREQVTVTDRFHSSRKRASGLAAGGEADPRLKSWALFGCKIDGAEGG